MQIKSRRFTLHNARGQNAERRLRLFKVVPIRRKVVDVLVAEQHFRVAAAAAVEGLKVPLDVAFAAPRASYDQW